MHMTPRGSGQGGDGGGCRAKANNLHGESPFQMEAKKGVIPPSTTALEKVLLTCLGSILDPNYASTAFL